MSAPFSEQALLDRLAENITFAGLDRAVLQEVLAAASLIAFSADEILLRQGDEATTFVMLVEGRAKLLQVTPDGTQILVRYIGPGKECGIVSMLPHSVNKLTAQAMDPGWHLRWPGAALASLAQTHPAIAMNALRLMTLRNEELQQRYQELLTDCVAQRLAITLLRLVGQAGRQLAQGTLIDLPLSREDLAQMAGTTLYTVSRTLSFWEQAGLIESGRGRVVILKMEEFEALAAAVPS